uniref:Ribosomal protein S3 n=1 Tax=Schizocladia ischiensis TaxID=196139 RepID=A0A7S6UA15_9STRA|nr:ribosomal protein S3 [Schizocladia ischiensis]QOW07595.1 ribosomal protein S3 [Schizocladia ischiensis]
MGQKTHPTALRPFYGPSSGDAYWDLAYLTHSRLELIKFLQACFRRTQIYLNKVEVNHSHGQIDLVAEVIQVHPRRGQKRKKKRRDPSKPPHLLKSWPQLSFRLQKALPIVQKSTGAKSIHLKIHRIKMYTKLVPQDLRKKMRWAQKKHKYARKGLQLLSLIMAGKGSAQTLASFINENLRSRQRRRKNIAFLYFLKTSLKLLNKNKKIQGIKIQVKGRYRHKPKARSASFLIRQGRLPLQEIQSPIDAFFTHSQTAYGSVGLKIWICPSQAFPKHNLKQG